MNRYLSFEGLGCEKCNEEIWKKICYSDMPVLQTIWQKEANRLLTGDLNTTWDGRSVVFASSNMEWVEKTRREYEKNGSYFETPGDFLKAYIFSGTCTSPFIAVLQNNYYKCSNYKEILKGLKKKHKNE